MDDSVQPVSPAPTLSDGCIFYCHINGPHVFIQNHPYYAVDDAGRGFFSVLSSNNGDLLLWSHQRREHKLEFRIVGIFAGTTLALFTFQIHMSIVPKVVFVEIIAIVHCSSAFHAINDGKIHAQCSSTVMSSLVCLLDSKDYGNNITDPNAFVYKLPEVAMDEP